MEYKATIIGATGLVGRFLVQELINDDNCQKVHVIVRRKTTFNHTKVKEYIIDFSREEDYQQHIKGNVLFSCLGTTRGKAKSIKNHYLVDYDYQFLAATTAVANGVQHYVLVSSPWANINSSNYYRKMKAELERDTANLPFQKVAFIKPNGLVGEREKPRFGERWGISIFMQLSKIFPSLKKHQPIQAQKVAEVMLAAFYKNYQSSTKVLTLQRDELNAFVK